MAQRPDLGKQRFWLDLISRWQRSQCSVRDFCDRHGVSEGSFYAWRRVLRERGLLTTDDAAPISAKAGASAGGSAGAAGAPRFVPVTVVGIGSVSPCLEVVLDDGLAVRVPVGFDAATLTQLLDVLRRRPC